MNYFSNKINIGSPGALILDSFIAYLNPQFCLSFGSVVGWLEFRDCARHSLGSKPTCIVVLCS